MHNGRAPASKITLKTGTVEVRAQRVNDRRRAERPMLAAREVSEQCSTLPNCSRFVQERLSVGRVIPSMALG